MSEFTLSEGSGYIFVGEYVHKFGKEMPLKEKKIGKTDSMQHLISI